MAAQRWMVVVWPAFLAAAVLEMLVFAAFDPHDLQWLAGSLFQPSRLGIYSLAFFVFWAVLLVTGFVTLWLAQTGRGVGAADTAWH